MSVAVIGRPATGSESASLNRITVFSFDTEATTSANKSTLKNSDGENSSTASSSPETIGSIPNNSLAVPGTSGASVSTVGAGPSSDCSPTSRLLTLRNNIRSLRPFCASEPNTRQNSVESSASSTGSDGYTPCSIGAWSCFEPGALTGGLYSACSSPSRSVPSSPCCGPKFKLIQEGDIQLCRLNHTRTVISKILSSKFLRRWETHHLYLEENDIRSKSPSGFMEEPIPYSQLEDVYAVARWDANHKFCIRIVIHDGSLLLQVNNVYFRDQWLHSILWKRSVLRYRKLLMNTRRPEVLLKELGSLVEMSLTTPLQDEVILQTPLEIISELLVAGQNWIPKFLNEEIITVICPLLERTTPSAEICDFFCRHCQDNPRSSLVSDNFTSVVERILKHNMDFGKYPKTRVFIQDYIQALNCQNDGCNVVRNFVGSMHGPASTCPHPRVLPNLVSVCLAAIHSIFEERRNFNREEVNVSNSSMSDWETRQDLFVFIIETMVSYEDWRTSLSQLLQPIPFPDDAIACERFTSKMKAVIQHISTDYRCDVHLMVLGIRDEKEGWFQLYCPGGIACDDEGDLWSSILKSLLACCCRRKRFLMSLTKYLGPCMLRALRDDETCQDALCSMLELDVVESKDMQLQIITTLQSTATGKVHYAALCSRQRHLRELQQKGGPRKLTLPSRSTDADVAKLLSCGSFGNLECLSLAFTQVTSACAEQLVKIPSLRYLNLWSTQFGDVGLQLISEHLPKLQVLNLCETPVTDKGLTSLAALKNLRKLNLNSTSLSAQTFESLKKKLPSLQECDIRYTEAW